MQIKDKQIRVRDRNIYRLFCVLLGLSIIIVGWGQYIDGSCSSLDGKQGLIASMRTIYIYFGPEWELFLLVLLGLYLFFLAWNVKLTNKRFGKKIAKS